MKPTLACLIFLVVQKVLVDHPQNSRRASWSVFFHLNQPLHTTLQSQAFGRMFGSSDGRTVLLSLAQQNFINENQVSAVEPISSRKIRPCSATNCKATLVIWYRDKFPFTVAANVEFRYLQNELAEAHQPHVNQMLLKCTIHSCINSRVDFPSLVCVGIVAIGFIRDQASKNEQKPSDNEQLRILNGEVLVQRVLNPRNVCGRNGLELARECFDQASDHFKHVTLFHCYREKQFGSNENHDRSTDQNRHLPLLSVLLCQT